MVQCSRRTCILLLFIAVVTILYLYSNSLSMKTSNGQVRLNTTNLKYTVNFNQDGNDVFSFMHVQKTGGTTFEKHLVFDIENSNCECDKTKKPSCMCYRKSMDEIWLVCRYIDTTWPCGLHPDLETLRECTPSYLDSSFGQRNRRYFYGTVLRDPIMRFLSELRHMQRGASWEAASPLCRGKLLMKQLPSCYEGKFWLDLTVENFISCPYNLAINRQTWMMSNISKIGCDFKEIMSNPKKQKQLLKIAKKNLRYISYFGLLEFPLESQFIFEKTFDMKFKISFDLHETGFANEYLKSFNQSDVMLEQVKKLNNLDVKFYDYAKTLFFERYNYFVSMHGKPNYKQVITRRKIPISKLQKNLPKSKEKELRLLKRREEERELKKLKKQKEMIESY